MNIEKIVQMLNSLATSKIFNDNTKFYNLIKSIIELTNISINYEISEDADSKMELLQTIIRKVSISIETEDKDKNKNTDKDLGFFYTNISTNLLRFCENGRFILEQINTRKLKNKIYKVSEWIYDDKIKEEILDNGEFDGEQLDTSDIFLLVKSLNNLEKKLKYLNLYKNQIFEENPKYVINIINSIESLEARLDFYKSLSQEEFDILEALDVNSDEFILSSLYRTDLDIEKKLDKIESLKSEENQILGIDIIVASNKNELIYVNNRLIELAEKMKNDENKERILSLAQYFRSEEKSELEGHNIQSYKTDIIASFISDEKKLEHIDEINDKEYIYNIILSFNDGKKMIEELINRNYFERFIQDGTAREKFQLVIKENINQILIYYGFEDKLDEKKKLLSKMEKDNSEIYSTIRFELLEDRYLQTFNITQLNIFASLWLEQGDIFKLDDNQLKICSLLLQNQKEDNFREFFCNILSNLKEYSKLVSNIDYSQLTKENIELLSKLLQFHNDLGIETLEELNDFEKTKQQKLDDSIVQNSNIKDIITAIIWKQYGMDFDTAKQLSIEFRFEQDDKQINQLNALIDYAEREIPDRELLKSIYNSVTQETAICDKINIRNQYKRNYEKDINSTLLKVDNLPQKKLDDGTIIYDAGTDFSMVITAVSPYSDDIGPDNSKENWNRADLGSEHFCASYIRSDMIGVCKSQKGIYYGFNQIPNDALMYMFIEDIQSTIDSRIHSSINGTTAFTYSDDLINETGKCIREDYYNELDIKRCINGNRIQPDYLVVFKNGGEYVNLSETIKASKEWGNLPIVEIDIDKCLEKQIEELNKMSDLYKMNPSKEELKTIWIKLNNMSNTIRRWRSNDYKEIIEHLNLPKELKENLKPLDIMGRPKLKQNLFDDEYKSKTSDEIIDNLKKAYSIAEQEINEENNTDCKNEPQVVNQEDRSIAEKKQPVNASFEETTRPELVDEKKYEKIYQKNKGFIPKALYFIKNLMNKIKSINGPDAGTR